MPCSKTAITKTYKCNKDGCLCIPSKGAARVCLSVNETGDIIRCDCKCDNKCECNENCTCINTAGLTCICVCRDQNGRIKTCEDCSCQPKQVQTQSCKGKSNETCCCNTGNEKCACLNCSCCEPGKNKCGKGSCVTCKGKKAARGCACKGTSTCACKPKQVEGSSKDITRQSTNCCGNSNEECKSSCVEQEDALANVCPRNACRGNCRCQGNAKSCVCLSKNKQGGTDCCDDCECDSTKTCDKKGCVCARKESSCKCKSLETRRCGSCDENCKCSGKKEEAASKDRNCAGSNCRGNCKCQRNKDSCVCVCQDKQGAKVCCDDCKCVGHYTTNYLSIYRCDKEGCVCIRKESTIKSVKINCCENCDENCKCQGNANSCVCICKNKQGETVCCDDCKCDSNNICDKKGCVCAPKRTSCKSQLMKTNCCENCDAKCKCSCVEQEAVFNVNSSAGKACDENCKCHGNADSCVCICKNKQGETACCDDCKCDGNNRCDKEGCVCIRKESTIKSVKFNCCENCDENCECSCVHHGDVIKTNSCAGKPCDENCKCQGSANSCVCICKNKQGETICCDDCKCDNNNICDKKGCICIRKESSRKCKSVEASCCENCDENYKCSCVDHGDVIKTNSCAGKVCAGNCKCLGNASSCVCICKNKQGETVCCNDCKCDSNNICDKKGCICIRKESSRKCKSVEASCCKNCYENCKCSCVDHGDVIKTNSCAGKACGENCKCQGNADSCVCICRNKQGETDCCDDCKCDNNNICDKKGCICIRKESARKSVESSCCENCDENCKCSCVDGDVTKTNSCAGKVCAGNCKCQGNANSCVCVCKNKEGEDICCHNCNCSSTQKCDKKGCACIPSGSDTCNTKTEPKCCC